MRDVGGGINPSALLRRSSRSVNLGGAWSLLDNYTRMAFPVKDIVNTLIAQVGVHEKKTVLIKPVRVLPPQ